MNLTEKCISQKYIFNGRIINLRVDDITLPNGEPAIREVVEHPGGVGVLALDENYNVICVRQYRYPYSEVTLEIPAGKKDKGEEPLICGMRELKEETGITAERFIPLGRVYPTPGYVDEVIHLFLALGLQKGECNPDEDEFVETEWIPLDTLVEMCIDDKITDAKTQTAVLKAAHLRQKGVI